MTRVDEMYLKGKLWAGVKVDEIKEYFTDERGDVNIVSMVVLIGIAVALAVVFRDGIKSLLESLMNTIKGNAEDAVG